MPINTTTTTTVNGTTITKHYDALGRLDWESDVSDAAHGGGTVVTKFLPANNPAHLVSVQTRFDAQGHLVSNDKVFDATSDLHDVLTLFDGQGRVKGVVESYNGGLKVNTDYDSAGTQGWASITTKFDPAHKMADTLVTRDDNSHLNQHMQGDASAASREVVDYDAAGRVEYAGIMLANGESHWSVTDTYGKQPWLAVKTDYIAGGRMAHQSILLDNGGRVEKMFSVSPNGSLEEHDLYLNRAGVLVEHHDRTAAGVWINGPGAYGGGTGSHWDVQANFTHTDVVNHDLPLL